MARLTPEQIYSVARAAGFPPSVAVTMVAIALKESGGDPMAHNPIPPDDSYGLWQINMIGDLGAQRLREFGLQAKTDLFNPAVNAAAAAKIWAGSDRNLALAWAIDRGFNQTRYLANLPRAQQAGVAVEPLAFSSPPAVPGTSSPAVPSPASSPAVESPPFGSPPVMGPALPTSPTIPPAPAERARPWWSSALSWAWRWFSRES